VITTDVDDIPLMDVRSIVLTPGDDDDAPPADQDHG
jgi:hypothetical protein